MILDFPVWMVGMPHLGFRENLVTVEFPDVMESMALKVILVMRGSPVVRVTGDFLASPAQHLVDYKDLKVCMFTPKR